MASTNRAMMIEYDLISQVVDVYLRTKGVSFFRLFDGSFNKVFGSNGLQADELISNDAHHGVGSSGLSHVRDMKPAGGEDSITSVWNVKGIIPIKNIVYLVDKETTSRYVDQCRRSDEAIFLKYE